MRVSHHNAKEYLALLKGLNLIAVEQEEPEVASPLLQNLLWFLLAFKVTLTNTHTLSP